MFEIREVPAQPVMTIRFRAAKKDIATRLGELLPRIFNFAAGAGLEPGLSFSRFRKDGPEVELEAGIIVANAGEDEGDIKAGELPAGRVAMMVYTGPQDGLWAAQRELIDWAKKQGNQLAGGPWEVYLSDPVEESNSRAWKTQIYVPLK